MTAYLPESSSRHPTRDCAGQSAHVWSDLTKSIGAGCSFQPSTSLREPTSKFCGLCIPNHPAQGSPALPEGPMTQRKARANLSERTISVCGSPAVVKMGLWQTANLTIRTLIRWGLPSKSKLSHETLAEVAHLPKTCGTCSSSTSQHGAQAPRFAVAGSLARMHARFSTQLWQHGALPEPLTPDADSALFESRCDRKIVSFRSTRWRKGLC